VVIGWGVFAGARAAHAMVPRDETAYTQFKAHDVAPDHYEPLAPFVYSLENSLPLVKLGQTDRWEPDPAPAWRSAANQVRGSNASAPPSSSLFASSRFLFAFQRLQVLLGWILATLFVAGVTGIVQKD
jgi:hypothetical protein